MSQYTVTHALTGEYIGQVAVHEDAAMLLHEAQEGALSLFLGHVQEMGARDAMSWLRNWTFEPAEKELRQPENAHLVQQKPGRSPRPATRRPGRR